MRKMTLFFGGDRIDLELPSEVSKHILAQDFSKSLT